MQPTIPSNTVLSLVLHGLPDTDVETQHGLTAPSHLIWNGQIWLSRRAWLLCQPGAAGWW